MIWGVPLLQLGFGVGHAEAVNRAAMIPLGWVFGSPILGFIADRMGRRKPVLIVSAFAMLGLSAAIVYLPVGTLPGLHRRPAARLCLRGGHDPLFDHQRSQSRPDQGQRDGRHELPRLYIECRSRTHCRSLSCKKYRAQRLLISTTFNNGALWDWARLPSGLSWPSSLKRLVPLCAKPPSRLLKKPQTAKRARLRAIELTGA